MTKFNHSQCRHILLKYWKLYQINVNKLNNTEEIRYQAVLRALNDLEDKELILLYKRYHAGLVLIEKDLSYIKKGINPRTHTLASRYSFDCPNSKQMAKRSNLSLKKYLELENRVLKKFSKSYSNYHNDMMIEFKKVKQDKEQTESKDLFRNYYKDSYERQEKFLEEFSKRN